MAVVWRGDCKINVNGKKIKNGERTKKKLHKKSCLCP